MCRDGDVVMGYRSTVYIKTPVEHKAELLKVLSDTDLLDSFTQASEDDNYTRFVGNYLKWYDGLNDVKLVNHFVEATPNTGLITVGENGTEEHYGDTYDIDMYVVQTMEW